MLRSKFLSCETCSLRISARLRCWETTQKTRNNRQSEITHNHNSKFLSVTAMTYPLHLQRDRTDIWASRCAKSSKIEGLGLLLVLGLVEPIGKSPGVAKSFWLFKHEAKWLLKRAPTYLFKLIDVSCYELLWTVLRLAALAIGHALYVCNVCVYVYV